MPEDHRPGAEEIVEVAAVVEIPEIGAASVFHHDFEAGRVLVTAEHAAGQHARGARNEILIAHR